MPVVEGGGSRSNVLPASEVARHAEAAGFRGDALITAVAIAKAESGFDALALGDVSLQTAKWGPSVGLWQIRSLNAETGTGRSRDRSRLTGPAFNARSAYSISGGGTNFTPWSVYKDGKYKKHLGEASSAVGGTGGAQAGATSPAPTGPPVLAPEAPSPSGAPISIRFGGTLGQGELGRAVVGGSVDFTTTEVSELTVVLEDPGLRIVRQHNLNVGSALAAYGLRWRTAEIQVMQGPANPHVVLRCHPAGAVRLREQSPKPARSISPTDYFASLAGQAGLQFVGEPTAAREIGPAMIQRKIGAVETQALQTAWEMGVYWAQQLGFLFFEAAGTLYFGSPRFLVRKGRKVQVSYGGMMYPEAQHGPLLRPLEVPDARASEREFIRAGTTVPGAPGTDTTTTYYGNIDRLRDRSVSALIEREPGEVLRPAMNVALAGVPPFDGTFLLMRRVSWSLADLTSPVQIEFGQAETLPAAARTAEDDFAARGSDITPPGSATAQGPRIRTAERIRYFGQPGDRARVVTFMTVFDLMVSVHQSLVEQWKAAALEAQRTSRWRPARIDSYNVRRIRGSDDWSLHSFGLAWDFFNTRNPSDVWGSINAPDAAFRAAFKKYGFHLGSEFSRRKDYPHIEWASAPPR
jgi:hypothetical protein